MLGYIKIYHKSSYTNIMSFRNIVLLPKYKFLFFYSPIKGGGGVICNYFIFITFNNDIEISKYDRILKDTMDIQN